ncbi:hypothetical protein Leryth_026806 [Lithospermum erythrorhizon]|nr:hypothetical protein Leryth_026806 [Lithospermum erythrorhizon]
MEKASFCIWGKQELQDGPRKNFRIERNGSLVGLLRLETKLILHCAFFFPFSFFTASTIIIIIKADAEFGDIREEITLHDLLYFGYMVLFMVEALKDLGAGNFGVARLVRDKKIKELFAVKYIERGKKIDENVQREIINHRSLRHPNIIRFKEVFLIPTQVPIVMEYAAGEELFAKICSTGRFSEDEARFFFQQLISGVSYCHSMEICHRDLKLENTLLDGSPSPLRFVALTAQVDRDLTLKCRTLIFVGDNSSFLLEALRMTAKLDRRYSALVEVQNCESMVTEEQPHAMLVPLEYFLLGYGLTMNQNRRA